SGRPPGSAPGGGRRGPAPAARRGPGRRPRPTGRRRSAPPTRALASGPPHTGPGTAGPPPRRPDRALPLLAASRPPQPSRAYSTPSGPPSGSTAAIHTGPPARAPVQGPFPTRVRCRRWRCATRTLRAARAAFVPGAGQELAHLLGEQCPELRLLRVVVVRH